MKPILFVAGMLAVASANPQSVPPAPVAPAPAPSPVAAPTVPTTPIVTPPPVFQQRKVPPSPAELRVRAANREAMQEPVTRAFLNAMQVYPYSEGVLYRLYAAPERVSDIVLQPGETIVSVAAGDTARWTVGDTSSGTGDAKRVHIFVKPFSAGLSTNLIITTDRRAYHLQLESTPATAMAALSWTYPQDELIAIRRKEAEARAAMPVAAGVSVQDLHFDYAITGDRPDWRPIRAFDDGQQTYIEFGADIAVGEAPPLFVLGEKGEAQLVNYRVAGRFYIVDRLFGAAELRLGAKKQAVVRITRVVPGRGARGKGRA
jgi:type IV secretion system protein TrbG